MKLLDRYIRTAVIGSTCVVAAILLGVQSFMQFFSQLNDIGKANYTAWKALLFILTKLPLDLYQFFPMIAFLGCLIGLGRLASQSELLVMRSNGVSIVRIAGSLIKTAVWMLIVVVFIGEFVAPALQISAEKMKAAALGREMGYKSLSGFWLRDKNAFVHIGSVETSKQIADVEVFDIDANHHLQVSARAKRGVLNKHGSWVLEDVAEDIFTANKVIKKHLKRLPMHFVFNPLIVNTGRKSVDQLSTYGLYKIIKYRTHAGLAVSQYRYAFWRRILEPVSIIVMICLGIPFIFGSLRSASMGLRIITGISVGFVFYMLDRFFGPLSMVYQIPSVLAAFIPTVFFAVACVILLRRIN